MSFENIQFSYLEKEERQTSFEQNLSSKKKTEKADETLESISTPNTHVQLRFNIEWERIDIWRQLNVCCNTQMIE